MPFKQASIRRIFDNQSIIIILAQFQQLLCISNPEPSQMFLRYNPSGY